MGTKTTTLSAFVLLTGTLICNTASAQSLEERVRELEGRVDQLEKLERQQPTTGASRKSTPKGVEPWRYMANWRSLKLGMTEKEVRSILGDPDKIEAGTLVTLWYYDVPKGGKVRLSSGEHRVEGWTEPEK